MTCSSRTVTTRYHFKLPVARFLIAKAVPEEKVTRLTANVENTKSCQFARWRSVKTGQDAFATILWTVAMGRCVDAPGTPCGP